MPTTDCRGQSIKKKRMEALTMNPLLKSFLAGSLSGTCSSLLFQPLDLVKTRLQAPINNAQGHSYPGQMMKLLVHVVKREKVTGLWRGTVPSIARCVPGVGLYFCSLHWLKVTLNKGDPTPIEALFLGLVARSFAGFVLLPITVLKTRYESGLFCYGSLTGGLRDIYRTEGTRGLYSGLVPTLVRDAPFSGLYYMFYLQMKKNIPKEWLEGGTMAPCNFACGVTAGLMASFVTQPADVIKTKMQLYPQRFGRVFNVALYIYREDGPTGFFKGVVPRMLRRTLMSAMAWTVYEQLMKNLHLK